ncbi:MAG: endonuclease III [Chitinophagaceae bacterium]
MTLAQKYEALITYFLKKNPNPQTELLYHNDYELLVATLLSAQCTDKRVNIVTPTFFKIFPTIFDLAKASKEDIFFYIKSISYPNNKAKFLFQTAQIIVVQYEGKIPMQIDLLMQLPGVGRKVANVLTSVLESQPNMAVDTHVFRVSHRLGLVKNAATPLAVEKQLIKHIPTAYIHKAHHWLILHGRYICKAKNPLCEDCELKYLCTYYKNIHQNAKKKKI